MKRSRLFLGGLAGLVLLAAVSQRVDAASDHGGIPRLGFADSGWFPVSDDFLPPLSGPGPVISDPKHPYYSNQSGRQPTDRVADVTNPILQQWVVERLKKSNAATLSGKI